MALQVPLAAMLIQGGDQVKCLLFARGMDGSLESGAQSWQEVKFGATRW